MGSLIDVERILEPYKILRNTDTLCVATIRQNILECPTVEAIPKDQYENRLKDDIIAILEEIKNDIDYEFHDDGGYYTDKDEVDTYIQQKIDKLKENNK